MTTIIRLSLRTLRREWRSGELGVLLGALMVAVTAMTAVTFFTDRVSLAVTRQASEILAADLVLRSGRTLDSGLLGAARDAGLETATKVSFPSVVLAGDASTLADIEAVSAGYPLRGQLRTADALLAPARPVSGVPPPGEAWAESRLLARLGVDTGVELEVGATRLRVTRVLDFAPDRGWRFADFAPTLLINASDVAATELVQPGSRVSHSFLFAGDPSTVRRFRNTAEPRLPDHESFRDLGDTRPEIRSGVDRSGQFLGLAALVATLLSAVALAMAARRYASRHLDRVALMKCMGASQRDILLGTLVELLTLALVGGVAGAALGYLAQQGLALLLHDLLGAALPAPSPRGLLLGIAVAVVLLTGFALPSLAALRHVSPARVLRRDLGDAKPVTLVAYLAATGAVVALLFWVVPDIVLVGYLFAGASITAAILALAGWLLVRALRGARGAAGLAWRYGLASIGRRGPDSVVQVVAFGLGLMALLLLTVVRNDLLGLWQATLPADAPNHFMINIQSDEQIAVGDFLAENAGVRPRLVPLVRARLTAINGVTTGELSFPTARGERFARRESNLSWTAEMNADNRVVAGSWWDDPASRRGEVSVEEDFARSVGIGISDQLSFDVAGETVAAKVTSLRQVQWDSFRPNFFMVFSPDVLDGYPATYISAIFLPEDRRGVLLDLVRQFPAITTIDMTAIYGQVRGVMDKASLAVQYVFVFTLLAGITVLLAAVQATRDERRYESAMLRTLGAGRKLIMQGIAVEFTVLGLLAGILAATGASIAAALLARNLFDLDYTPSLSLWLGGLLAGAVLVGVSGVVATLGVIRQPPVRILRG